MFYVAQCLNLTNGNLLPGMSPDDFGLGIVETQPNSVLGLEAKKIRWWYRRVPTTIAFVCPFGVDLHRDELTLRCYDFKEIGVWWKENPDYAERVIDWWRLN